MLTEVAYLTRPNTFFDIPVHPGDTLVHTSAATGQQIAETICPFNQEVIAGHLLYEQVKSAF